MFSVYYVALLIPAVIGEANSYTHNMVYTAVPNPTVQQNHLGKGDGESSSPPPPECLALPQMVQIICIWRSLVETE